MRFDVVIGNPPYNKGMDLDFINLGFELCSKYCAMVVPAKWQTASDDYRGCASKTINYKQFREKLVPHMSHVVFYPEGAEIFEIRNVDGITYFLLDKQNKHEKCLVVNKHSKHRHFNSVVERSMLNRESLHNIGNEIIERLGDYKPFEFIYPTDKKYKVSTGNQVNGGNGWGYKDRENPCSTFDKSGQLKCIGSSIILEGDEEDNRGASSIIFSSDKREDCDSFISWLDCKFTRFFVAINISKLTGILTNDCFRFVPAPPIITSLNSDNPWNHIYTDEELYKYFKIPQKYIDVIESIIKER